MAGSITTISWCLVKDTIAYTGTKSEIVHSLGKVDLNDENRIVYKMLGCYPITLNGYITKEEDDINGFTRNEMIADGVEVIFGKLTSCWGYKLYQQIR